MPKHIFTFSSLAVCLIHDRFGISEVLGLAAIFIFGPTFKKGCLFSQCKDCSTKKEKKNNCLLIPPREALSLIKIAVIIIIRHLCILSESNKNEKKRGLYLSDLCMRTCYLSIFCQSFCARLFWVVYNLSATESKTALKVDSIWWKIILNLKIHPCACDTKQEEVQTMESTSMQ